MSATIVLGCLSLSSGVAQRLAHERLAPSRNAHAVACADAGSVRALVPEDNAEWVADGVGEYPEACLPFARGADGP
jgi:hypothetical protein